MILDKIESLLVEVKEMKASNAEEIEALRLKYLSKKGEINAVMADFRNVPADQKKEVGMKSMSSNRQLSKGSMPCVMPSKQAKTATRDST